MVSPILNNQQNTRLQEAAWPSFNTNNNKKKQTKLSLSKQKESDVQYFYISTAATAKYIVSNWCWREGGDGEEGELFFPKYKRINFAW